MMSFRFFLIVPEKPGPVQGESLQNQLGGIRHVFTSSRFWRTAPLTTMSQAAFLSIQGLWAGPWLRDVSGLARPGAADVLFWVAMAMIAGFIILWPAGDNGTFSDLGFKTGFAMMLGLQGIALIWFIVASKRFHKE